MPLLKIHIERLHNHPADKRSTLFISSIDYNENVSFPFEKVVQIFKLLYLNIKFIFNFTILYFMEKLSLKMVFSDENGNKVDAMSSDCVSPEMVMSALSFMKKGCSINLEVIGLTVLPDGK